MKRRLKPNAGKFIVCYRLGLDFVIKGTDYSSREEALAIAARLGPEAFVAQVRS